MTFDGIDEGRQPKPAHMKIAKNYYGHDELLRLRTIADLALDFLALQAEQGRLATVAQYSAKLRELVKLDGRQLMQEGHLGRSKAAADRKAVQKRSVYKQRVRLEKEAAGERGLEELLKVARKTIAENNAVGKAKARVYV